MITNCNSFLHSSGDGYIQIVNRGYYLAEFGIDYFYDGSYFGDSSGILTSYPYKLYIPAEATNIILSVIGYADPSLGILFYMERFQAPVKKCYMLQGVPYNWQCLEIPCSSGNVGSTSNPPCCNCCYNCCSQC